MYAAYFGLKQEPFSIAPDPHYLFMSERHREALAHLLYGLGGGGGFVLLTGEIGTGKTTLCRLFLGQVPANCNVAYVFNPKLTVAELLEAICEEFRIEVPRAGAGEGVKHHVDRLNTFLLEQHSAGRNNVLVIDEAQNLSAEVLEQLRLLTNLETSERKLLQIILIGQPELRDMLARPELEQLRQRVIARYHLGPLSPAETEQYIRHRMDVAGLHRPFPFEPSALRRIHRLTAGVPRRINLLCDRALLGAFGGSHATVDRRIVSTAASEVFGTGASASTGSRWSVPAMTGAAVVLLAGLIVGGGLWIKSRSTSDVATAGEAATTTPPAAPAQGDVASPAVGASGIVPTAMPSTAPAVAALPPRLLHDMNDAWRELAALWQVEVPSGDPCTWLPQQELQCFARPLNLALIRELDRPGILKLDAASGAPVYALLVGLTRDTATLRSAGTEQKVTLAALAERWSGEFATLWRSPPGYAGRTEAHGPLVDWMAARLAANAGEPPPGEPAALDAPLRARIRAFQVASGLPADGQPGPLTYMQLNRASGQDEPRLNTGP